MIDHQNTIADISPFELNKNDMNGNSRKEIIASLEFFQSKLENIAKKLILGSRRKGYNANIVHKQRNVDIPKKGLIYQFLFKYFGLPLDNYCIYSPVISLRYGKETAFIEFMPATSGIKYASIEVIAGISANKVALQKARQISNILDYGGGYIPVQFNPIQFKNKSLEIFFPTKALSEVSLRNLFHGDKSKPKITEEHIEAYFKSLPSL